MTKETKIIFGIAECCKCGCYIEEDGVRILPKKSNVNSTSTEVIR